MYGCVVDMHHHLRRKSDSGFDLQEYIDKPYLYESVFAKEVIFLFYMICIINLSISKISTKQLKNGEYYSYLELNQHKTFEILKYKMIK